MRKDLFLIAFTISVFGISCQKGEDELLNKPAGAIDLRSSVSRLSYGANLFYKNEKGSKTVSPVSRSDFQGHFTSIPLGLALDRRSGNINLEKSKAGQPYKIFYVNEKGVLTDSVRIVISGVDYLDGVYNLEDKKSKFGEKSMAFYDGDATKPIPSNFFNSFIVSYKETEDDSEDATGLNVSRKNGVIDLKKSKSSGLFGTTNPRNGAYNELVIKYRLADKSGRKINTQKINFYYFKKDSDIPQALKAIISDRKRIMDRVNSMPPPGNASSQEGTEEALEDDLESFERKIRPPLIVVTG